MDDAQKWYIVKNKDGVCHILSLDLQTPDEDERWGPFSSQDEALAKRVGLIRSGKCQPQ